MYPYMSVSSLQKILQTIIKNKIVKDNLIYTYTLWTKSIIN